MRTRSHRERHRLHRTGWLRAAVLGANDGLISTASLVIGVAAAGTGPAEVLVAGLAGLVAGAMAMAAGEYVSVSSQADTEAADRAREAAELAAAPGDELAELQAIYEARGLDPALAAQVAARLTAHDALNAHLRDELGLTEAGEAHPVQAALVSALTFTGGAALPLIVTTISPAQATVGLVAATTLVALVGLGALGAAAGGAGQFRGAARVLVWGALAMAATAGAGWLFGAAVG